MLYQCFSDRYVILYKCENEKKDVNYLLLFRFFENLLFIILILLDNIFLCVESTNWLS
jgi:hypothetical protein